MIRAHTTKITIKIEAIFAQFGIESPKSPGGVPPDTWNVNT